MTSQAGLSHNLNVAVDARTPWYRDWMMLATLIASVAADQITKMVVKTSLVLGESWPIDGFFRISYGTNSGSIFGLFQDHTLILTIASIFAIGFVIYYYHAQSVRPPLTRFTVGLLLGGALGNLVDRLRMGEVVDFIDVGPWPVFNLADSSIVVGMVLLVTSVLLIGGDSINDEHIDADVNADISPEGQP